MKLLPWLLISGVLAASEAVAGETADDQLKRAVTALIEHTARLEEQNKATQQQLAMLERQMEKRFEAIDKRFEDMDKRFSMLQDHMEKRFTMLEGHMNKRFDAIDKRFEEVDKRFDLMLWVFGVLGTLLTCGLGYLIYVCRGIGNIEGQLREKPDIERVVRLETRVEGIQRELERGRSTPPEQTSSGRPRRRKGSRKKTTQTAT